MILYNSVSIRFLGTGVIQEILEKLQSIGYKKAHSGKDISDNPIYIYYRHSIVITLIDNSAAHPQSKSEHFKIIIHSTSGDKTAQVCEDIKQAAVEIIYLVNSLESSASND